MHLAATTRSRTALCAASALGALLVAGCGGGGSGGVLIPPPAPAPTPAPAPAPAEPTLRLDGALDRPADLTAQALAARTPITQSVSFASGAGPQTHSYTGASLWQLLSDAGLQTDPSRKNDLHGRFVVATGADGYRAIFSLGELNPAFGNKPSIVAYATTVDVTTAALPPDDGPLRLTAPGDVRGGRYVSNLVRLEVRAAPATATGAGGVPASFSVSGAVAAGASYDIQALRGLPTVTHTAANGDVYTGVSLWTLLDSIGLKTPEGAHNPALAMFAVATGSDGYRAVLGLGEIHPGFGNNGALVAYQLNGAPLADAGMARLVLPHDVRRGRWVSNLQAIEVFGLDGGN